MTRATRSFLAFVLGGLAGIAHAQIWVPAENSLMTRWAATVSPERVWPEYPRPQMARKEWKNLNGLWDYALTPRSAAAPERFEGKILVPFAIESALSGVKRTPTPEQRLWYRRSFAVPPAWRGKRVLLHFGAVDWHATVFLNGRKLGEHKGGYTPFSFDLTDALTPEGEQELKVAVWDPTDSATQPRGKQVREPGGIWYTSVTGIWQTVWLEPVPRTSIRALRAVPDIDSQVLRLTLRTRGPAAGYTVRVRALDGGRKISEARGVPGREIVLPVENPKLWSPESPHLYDLEATLLRGDAELDTVSSYFGMRKSSLGKDEHGRVRLMLNNKPYFQIGPLDQGWWPDGLYTAPSDEALRYDIEILRKLGFNMARKHVKVEPARWYYHCDRLGLLVWQDMPNGNLRRDQPNNLRVSPTDSQDADRPADSAAQFEAELKELIDNFSHFPSIVMWVPFNEGWGQYDTARIARWIKLYDPSRLVNSASGWTDRGVGDVYDTHIYPGPGIEDAGPKRATVLGEFGGLGWPVDGHLWWTKRNWGYRTFFSREELNAKYREVVGDVYGLLGFGLSAAIYTQTTDVEGEVNGLMTYDREVLKFDPEEVGEIHRRLRRASLRARVLVATSELEPQTWSYSFSPPGEKWAEPDFDAADWERGAAPFQTGDDELFPTGTKWASGPLWARRTFTLDAVPDNLWMILYHRVDKGGVYLNGKLVVDLEGARDTRRHYRHLSLSEHAGTLREGENVIAIHGERAEGSPGFDAGLYTLRR